MESKLKEVCKWAYLVMNWMQHQCVVLPDCHQHNRDAPNSKRATVALSVLSHWQFLGAAAAESAWLQCNTFMHNLNFNLVYWNIKLCIRNAGASSVVLSYYPLSGKNSVSLTTWVHSAFCCKTMARRGKMYCPEKHMQNHIEEIVL